jgi:GNAT superfamily N-acetyltransferase
MSSRRPSKRIRRNSPCPATPTTFGDECNWDNVIEYSIHNPTAEPGVVTLLGPTRCRDSENDVWAVAVAAVRELGLKCRVLPEVLSEEDREWLKPDENSEETMEELYLGSDEISEFVENGGIAALDDEGSTQCKLYVHSESSYGHWLLIRCETDRYVEELTNLLYYDWDRFSVCALEHTRKELPEPRPGYKLMVETGGSPDRLGTRFSLLYGRDKLVGKAQCAYYDGDGDTAGPTLEQMEIAKEWRGQGLGTDLLAAMELFYKHVFQRVFTSLYFSVAIESTATSSQTNWFIRQGYTDADDDLLCKKLFKKPY